MVIARRLLGQHEQEPEKKTSPAYRKLPIRGASGMLVSFAKCCRPIPGDAIVAHISPGKGLVVHQEGCPNIRGYNREPDKYQPVQWDMEHLGEQEFKTGIQVEVVNHQGVLAQLANVISATGANIHSISTEEKDARVYQVNLLITAKHRVHLADIMRKIRVMPDVLRVNRTTSRLRTKEADS